MQIPLHIKPSDSSADANLARIALYQQMFALTGGKGFRQISKKGRTRIERLGHESFSN